MRTGSQLCKHSYCGNLIKQFGLPGKNKYELEFDFNDSKFAKLIATQKQPTGTDFVKK